MLQPPASEGLEMVNHNLISMEQLLYLEYKSLHDLRRRVKPELIWIRECINYLKERAAPFGIGGKPLLLEMCSTIQLQTWSMFASLVHASMKWFHMAAADLDFWTVDFFLENVEDMPKSLQADLYRAWYFTDLNEEIVRHNKKVEILLWHIRRRRGAHTSCA